MTFASIYLGQFQFTRGASSLMVYSQKCSALYPVEKYENQGEYSPFLLPKYFPVLCGCCPSSGDSQNSTAPGFRHLYSQTRDMHLHMNTHWDMWKWP